MNKLDMSDKRLEWLTLSEKTVRELFVACLWKETDTGGYINANFYDRSSSRYANAPVVKMNAKVYQYTNVIRYLLGQLQAVHENRWYLTPGAGSVDYTGNRWTRDNNMLSALYYLSTASGALWHFVDGEKYAYTRLDDLLTHLIPTYPPGDPNFSVDHKIGQWALQGLGIIPEE